MQRHASSFLASSPGKEKLPTHRNKYPLTLIKKSGQHTYFQEPGNAIMIKLIENKDVKSSKVHVFACETEQYKTGHYSTMKIGKY